MIEKVYESGYGHYAVIRHPSPDERNIYVYILSDGSTCQQMLSRSSSGDELSGWFATEEELDKAVYRFFLNAGSTLASSRL